MVEMTFKVTKTDDGLIKVSSFNTASGNEPKVTNHEDAKEAFGVVRALATLFEQIPMAAGF